MECKEKKTSKTVKQTPVLIETLWNVKNTQPVYFSSLQTVLIETLWNVKTLGALTVNSVAGVLIETLWNVKFNHLN